MPEAGGDSVDVHVLAPRTMEQLQVLHIPWFFAISILSWLFIVFFVVFCAAWRTQKMRAAEARRVGSDYGVMKFTGSMGKCSRLFL